MSENKRARAVGFNHIALEVGDIEEALSFYGRIFEFELRGKSDNMAFIDLGDQFLALQKGRSQPSDGGRHFGLVVDDKEVARRARPRPACNLCQDRSSTSATLGAHRGCWLRQRSVLQSAETSCAA